MIKKLDGVMSKIEEYVLSYSVIIMSILLIINVIMRTVFNRSLTFQKK